MKISHQKGKKIRQKERIRTRKLKGDKKEEYKTEVRARLAGTEDVT